MSSRTDEQQNIVDAVQAGNRSLVVQAGPGCGKTYTNVQTMAVGKVGYKMAMAFNKAIADELKAKAPSGIEVRTSHAVGFAMLKKRFKSQLISASPFNKNSKPYQLTQRIFPGKFANEFGTIGNMLVAGMDKCGFGADADEDAPGFSPSDWVELAAELEMKNDEKKAICERMPQLLEANMEMTEQISFADMVLQPLYHGLEPQFKQTQLWGDEIQDWSSTQLRLARLMCSDRTLVYGFGDKFQSIYAFRGADIHAVDNFAAEFNCQAMPLTRSFRCPGAVVELLKKRNPALNVPDDAINGEVIYDPKDFAIDPKREDRDTMIICRLNSPLFSVGLRFLSEGYPVRVSSNLPTALKAVIRSFKTDDKEIFQERLEIWFRDQLEYAGDNPHLSGAANDKYSALVSLLKYSETVADMSVNIDKLTRGHEGPLLATVHKAKGLEAKRVILLKSGMLTWPGEENMRASTPEDLEQEWNIWFVACSRAKEQLIFA